MMCGCAWGKFEAVKTWSSFSPTRASVALIQDKIETAIFLS